MSFEENRDDYWDGKGGPSHSKMNLLRVAVSCGAIQTGYELASRPEKTNAVFVGWWTRVELPYDGANAHAEELAKEGLLERNSEQPLAGSTLWVPTALGRILGR